jgi:hypothetical protein
MSFLDFDSSTVAPAAANDPLPAGTYNVIAIESEVKALKSGNGKGIALTFQVVDGQFAKRRIWTNINYQHSNPTAQQIGQQQLSAIMHAVGIVGKLGDTSRLHNKPLKVKVRIKKDDQYGDKNEITAYEAAGPLVPGAATMPPAMPTAAAPQQSAAPTPPWAAAKAA